ncbi:VP1 protein [Miniopterus schreibersii polyomavirus 1]|uniref:VP1 protein n=1 Tax=Miniopterus schreibersii polyomavirus 1 TaxID=1904408 RepID=A0A1S7J004_9POLY|nr:VP1 protein [Miniopterus schreibersii polyomavirus 1]BAX01862.1 VP1 protein [Miniopterus schreibersii polyomavirus 1]BAX01874.1 VP1 protein [Miniopterus schreibersii polyomavirus 1]
MAPKKRPRSAAACPPSKKAKSCPIPTPVPKLLIKGGVEVLNVVTGPDATTEIELFLEPRMGINNVRGNDKNWYGYSEVVHADDATKTMLSTQLPQYSCARVQLPMLNEDMTCPSLLMWEAVSCKTELVGIGGLISTHIKETAPGSSAAEPPGLPIEGINYHMFAVGGEPLDLQGYEPQADQRYAYAEVPQTIHPNDVVALPLNTVFKLQGLVPAAKAKLDKDGFYPVEEWGPDPSKNENSRYYGSFVGGLHTPPSLQFTNSLTTVLLDEYGVGPLCKGDGLFVSCADIVGLLHKANSGIRFRGLPRYFKITLRKRAVKNPYPISSLLGSLFSGLMPKIDGQPMSGPQAQIEEVRVFQGTEGLPADPDLRRYIDQFGQEQTPPPLAKAINNIQD